MAAQLGMSNTDEMKARAIDLIDTLNIYQYGCTARDVKHGKDGSSSHAAILIDIKCVYEIHGSSLPSRPCLTLLAM